jgi:hypothetical protein
VIFAVSGLYDFVFPSFPRQDGDRRDGEQQITPEERLPGASEQQSGQIGKPRAD